MTWFGSTAVQLPSYKERDGAAKSRPLTDLQVEGPPLESRQGPLVRAAAGPWVPDEGTVVPASVMVRFCCEWLLQMQVVARQRVRSRGVFQWRGFHSQRRIARRQGSLWRVQQPTSPCLGAWLAQATCQISDERDTCSSMTPAREIDPLGHGQPHRPQLLLAVAAQQVHEARQVTVRHANGELLIRQLLLL
jgi:hypothetical protein